MQILTVDIGTGTQDIFLYQSELSIENGFKLVMPSPTMIVRQNIQEATMRGETILLSGTTMGGGPNHWAAEKHIHAGYKIFATPEAARSFNDDLDWVQREMGILVVSEEEALSIRETRRIIMQDFDYRSISSAFSAFGVSLSPAAVGVAVFDHGEAPPEVSDRQFRFDYLEERMRGDNRLLSLAYPAQDVPPIMSRMRAVVQSAESLPCPLILMDTAPAAVLGATMDTVIRNRDRVIIMNIGNFHTLAFQLGPTGVEGLFEHHTGLLDVLRLEKYIIALANGTLTREEIYNDQGHGALILDAAPYSLDAQDWNVAITGPRREMMNTSGLRLYYAVPFGDMMLTGCFGLMAAIAEYVPELTEVILNNMSSNEGIAPWDLV